MPLYENEYIDTISNFLLFSQYTVLYNHRHICTYTHLLSGCTVIKAVSGRCPTECMTRCKVLCSHLYFAIICILLSFVLCYHMYFAIMCTLLSFVLCYHFYFAIIFTLLSFIAIKERILIILQIGFEMQNVFFV